MEENKVKEYTENWLKKQSNVTQVLKEQIIISEGLATDLMGIDSAGEIVYIVECKGSVDLGELAKGIGQCYQYNYQKSLNRKAVGAEVILSIPKDRNDLLDLLKIPEGIKIYLVDENGDLFERVKRKIGKPSIELQLPQTFYIRDIELDHIKYLIQLIYDLGIKSSGKLSVKEIEKEVKKHRPQIAASGYNHLITIRALGLINSQNKLTPEGYHILGLIEKSNVAFQKEMCKYFYCFIINVINAILIIAKERKQKLDSIKCTNSEIADKICSIWGDRVRFMYDPRTISTVIRILKELGVLKVKREGRYEIVKLIHPEFLPWGTNVKQSKLKIE